MDRNEYDELAEQIENQLNENTWALQWYIARVNDLKLNWPDDETELMKNLLVTSVLATTTTYLPFITVTKYPMTQVLELGAKFARFAALDGTDRIRDRLLGGYVTLPRSLQSD